MVPFKRNAWPFSFYVYCVVIRVFFILLPFRLNVYTSNNNNNKNNINNINKNKNNNNGNLQWHFLEMALHPLFPDGLEFRSGRMKTGEPGEEPSDQGPEKLNPHMTPGP